MKTLVPVTGTTANAFCSRINQDYSDSGVKQMISKRGGAAARIRTGDLRITNALLYQLSYSGTC